jgi:hypothetical protein
MSLPQYSATQSANAKRCELLEILQPARMARQIHLVEIAMADAIVGIFRATPHFDAAQVIFGRGFHS